MLDPVSTTLWAGGSVAGPVRTTSARHGLSGEPPVNGEAVRPSREARGAARTFRFAWGEAARRFNRRFAVLRVGAMRRSEARAANVGRGSPTGDRGQSLAIASSQLLGVPMISTQETRFQP